MSIKVHNGNTLLQWYLNLSSNVVSPDDKVIATNTVIFKLDNDENNIAEVIKYILAKNNTELIKELVNIQIHNQQGIKWYLNSNNVSHNDKVIAANTVIPKLDNDENSIAEVIKYIFTKCSTNIMISKISCDNLPILFWYYDSKYVINNNKVEVFKKFLNKLSDNAIAEVIKYILIKCSSYVIQQIEESIIDDLPVFFLVH